MTVLLDSVILIDHLNGADAATTYLERIREQGAISVITRAEVLAGYEPRQAGPVMRLLEQFPTLPIERETADLAARLRRRHRWKLPDAFQAALAQLHGLKLATRNRRDFPAERFEFVVEPYLL